MAPLDGADEPLGLERGRRGEGDERLAVARLDLLDTHRARGDADAHDVEKLPGGSGQRAEPVGQLRAEVGNLRVAGGTGEALVEGEPLIDLWHKVIG